MADRRILLQKVLRGHTLYQRRQILQKTSFYNTACQKACYVSSASNSVIDLRSDTLTKPTAKMREAMRNAVVGDDVYGEDPTVNEFQEKCAGVLGKEAALLLPTCTMANTASVLVHCDGRFNEIIVGEQSHMHLYEVSGMAQFAGVQGNCVPNLPDGTMDLKAIESKIRPLDDDHQPWTRVICLENTQNKCGGKVLSLDYMSQVKKFAMQHNLKVHLDGARMFNAAASLGVKPSEVAQYFDSVSTAFSKGLCCPLGSVLAGTKYFINLARRARKALGGGMRQAGIVAAPMLVALQDMISRLPEDHDRAYRIAQAVDSMTVNNVCSVSMPGVQSNIVMIDFQGKVTPSQFAERMKTVTSEERKSLGQSISVLMLPFSRTTVRYVTHNDIKDEDVDKVNIKVKFVIEELSSL